MSRVVAVQMGSLGPHRSSAGGWVGKDAWRLGLMKRGTLGDTMGLWPKPLKSHFWAWQHGGFRDPVEHMFQTVQQRMSVPTAASCEPDKLLQTQRLTASQLRRMGLQYELPGPGARCHKAGPFQSSGCFFSIQRCLHSGTWPLPDFKAAAWVPCCLTPSQP